MTDAEVHTFKVLTPEGISLGFRPARAGDRCIALLIDLVLMGLMVAGLVLVVVLFGGSGWAAGAALFSAFVVRNFYFVFFEVRRQGATPGKRRMRIRVVDRRGGALTAGAVFARNLTRELETFLPIAAVANPEMISPTAPGWVAALAAVWLIALLFLPLLNRERLRVGDLVAGTVVVQAPRTVLLADLAQARKRGRRPEAAHVFTPAQLDLYGIYELQILEDLLRHPGRENVATRREVAKRIRKKIGYRGPIPDVTAFLSDFYAAQRARLEQAMLLGDRRERKR